MMPNKSPVMTTNVNCYDFLSKVNCNSMPICHSFEDISTFNILVIKLIKLITIA